MHRRVWEVASYGIRHGAASALVMMSLQSGQDLLAMAMGFLRIEDPDDHEEDIMAFADHAEAIVQIPPEIVLQKLFLGD